MALQSDQEFAPTQIARAVFPTAFRGYDQDAVRRYLSRLASALEHQQEYAGLGELEARTPAHERVEELEIEAEDLRQEIRDLELELVQKSVIGDDNDAQSPSEPPPDAVPFDEHRAIELLGKETARVLESARSAAADILKRAETQAASLKAQAKSELAEARRRAESLVTEKQAETDELTTRLTGEAQAEADRIAGEAEEHRSAVLAESAKILTEAEQLAASEQQDAEDRAKQIVADAETLRQQVVSELVVERREAQVEMDRMTSARDRLAMSLAVARSELDEVADALVGATAAPSSKSKPGDPDSAPVDDGSSHREEVAGLIDQLETQGSGAEMQSSGGESETTETLETGPFFVDEITEEPDTEPDKERADNRSKRSKKRQKAKNKHNPKGSENEGQPKESRDSVAAAPDTDDSASTGTADDGPATSDDDVVGVVDDGDVVADGAGTAADEVAGDEPDQGDRTDDHEAFDETAEVVEIAQLIALDGSADASEPGVAADEPNRLPANGQELSLVEGFTTIDVNDVDLRDASTEDAERLPEETDGPRETADGLLATAEDGDGGTDDPKPDLVHSVMVNERHTPEEVITTVASRTAATGVSRTQGDLLLDRPFTGRLPKEFAAREVALTRSGPNFRRQLRRALNDDQSDVLDRLRAGRGVIKTEELPDFADQIDRYLAPLRRGLAEIAQAGAKAGGQADLSHAALDNLVRQLAKYIVDRVRTPTIDIVEADTERDRERILEPIRALYRDFRNIGLAELSEDALYEAFAIGLYDSIEPSAPVSWRVDPRSDPDPICDINRQRNDVVKGATFPSGHARPLALPGCRCLVTVSEY